MKRQHFSIGRGSSGGYEQQRAADSVTKHLIDQVFIPEPERLQNTGTWVTQTGREVNVRDMGVIHLRNTYKMMCRLWREGRAVHPNGCIRTWIKILHAEQVRRAKEMETRV